MMPPDDDDGGGACRPGIGAWRPVPDPISDAAILAAVAAGLAALHTGLRILEALVQSTHKE